MNITGKINTQWKRGDPIKCFRDQIPKFETPCHYGERHEAWVSDTLDLQERATLAINGLTGGTDPIADYEIYWRVSFANNPPIMRHSYSDTCKAKFIKALPLMWIVSVSDLTKR